MATVIADDVDARLEFTALELDLFREIAFNTGKSLNHIVAERISHGIIVDRPGEDDDYEFRYDTSDEGPEIDLGENGLDTASIQLRGQIKESLTHLYNIAWSHGLSSVNGICNEDMRGTYVDTYTNALMKIGRDV